MSEESPFAPEELSPEPELSERPVPDEPKFGFVLPEPNWFGVVDEPLRFRELSPDPKPKLVGGLERIPEPERSELPVPEPVVEFSFEVNPVPDDPSPVGGGELKELVRELKPVPDPVPDPVPEPEPNPEPELEVESLLNPEPEFVPDSVPMPEFAFVVGDPREGVRLLPNPGEVDGAEDPAKLFPEPKPEDVGGCVDGSPVVPVPEVAPLPKPGLVDGGFEPLLNELDEPLELPKLLRLLNVLDGAGEEELDELEPSEFGLPATPLPLGVPPNPELEVPVPFDPPARLPELEVELPELNDPLDPPNEVVGGGGFDVELKPEGFPVVELVEPWLDFELLSASAEPKVLDRPLPVEVEGLVPVGGVVAVFVSESRVRYPDPVVPLPLEFELKLPLDGEPNPAGLTGGCDVPDPKPPPVVEPEVAPFELEPPNGVVGGGPFANPEELDAGVTGSELVDPAVVPPEVPLGALVLLLLLLKALASEVDGFGERGLVAPKAPPLVVVDEPASPFPVPVFESVPDLFGVPPRAPPEVPVALGSAPSDFPSPFAFSASAFCFSASAVFGSPVEVD